MNVRFSTFEYCIHVEEQLNVKKILHFAAEFKMEAFKSVNDAVVTCYYLQIWRVLLSECCCRARSIDGEENLSRSLQPVFGRHSS